MIDTCMAEPGCERSIYGRGMCNMHWLQARRGKRPFVLPSRIPLPHTATPADRFWIKVDKTDECWLWTAATMPNGYGRFDKMLAHHFLVGKPPSGYEWDHLCFVRNCIRPDHLELVTREENIRRQRQHGAGPSADQYCKNGHLRAEHTILGPDGKKRCRACHREAQYRHRGGGPLQSVTHCKHGHEFTPENTYIRTGGNRTCRTCQRERARQYRAAGATGPLASQSSRMR